MLWSVLINPTLINCAIYFHLGYRRDKILRVSSLFYFAARSMRFEAEICNIKGISRSCGRIANIIASLCRYIYIVYYSRECLRVLGITRISAWVSFSQVMCIFAQFPCVMTHRTPRRVSSRWIMRSYIQPYRFAKRRETIFLLLRKNSCFAECIRAFHLILRYSANALNIFKGLGYRDIAKLYHKYFR